LYARSSVSKLGIILANSVGIIDSGYRGSLMAAFYNTSEEPVKIMEGDRIVQICMPDLSYNFTINCVNDLDKTERGECGLGSTGK
jgi:dUTP pyrophosphatase